MIKCNSPQTCCTRCVVEMDPQQTFGGETCCRIAEGCKFRREEILTRCKYAEPGDIMDGALKELFS